MESLLKKPTYTKNQVNSLLNNLSSEAGFQFTDNAYLTYSGLSGTQSGTLGTTLVSPGLWRVTQPGTMYYVDPTDGPITVLVPNADSTWENKTFSFLKPGQSQNSNSVTLSTAAGQTIGASLTYYELTQPANFVHLLATKYGTLGTTSYRWRRAMYNVSPVGIFTVNPYNGFLTIGAAISAAAEKANVTNPYVVNINSGIYVENNPITLPPYVAVQGDARDVVIIKPLNADNNIFECNNTNVIRNLTFSDLSGAAAINIDNITPYANDSIIIQDINFLDCKTWIQAVNPTNDVVIDSHNIDGKGYCDKALNFVATSGISQNIYGIIHNIEYIAYTGDVCKLFAQIQGELVDLTINALDVEGHTGTVDAGIRFYDGCKIYSNDLNFTNAGIGLSGDNLGAAPYLQVTNFTSTSCIEELNLRHLNMVGFLGGYYNSNHTILSENFKELRQASEAGGGLHVVGNIHQKVNQLIPDLDISQVIRNTTSMGLVSGGAIDLYSGLSAIVFAGNGYVKDPSTGDIIYEVSWPNTIIEVPSAANSYIVYEYATGIGYQSNIPSYETSIVLGEVICVNGTIDHIIDAPVTMKQQGNGVEATLRNGFGPVYNSGSIVSTDVSLTLSATQGTYYYGSEIFELSGGNGILWESYYKKSNGIWTEVEDVSAIDTAYYNPSTGNLSAMTAGYYAKHGFYTVGRDNEETYLLVYAQDQHDTITSVLTASLPPSPSFFSNIIVPVASIITKQGSTDVTISDIRPRFGSPTTIAAVGGGGVTVHANLLGLNVDDHKLYLLADGTRAMNGALNMGGNSIIGVSAVDGVDVGTHAARHLPGGADELTVGTPSTINQTNQVGIIPAFARQDHIHAHGSQSGVNNHALVTSTTHGFMASTDKIDLTSVHTTVNTTSTSWESSVEYSGLLMGTGLVSGGRITINADTTKFDVAAGHGYMVDNTSSPGVPVVTHVHWNDYTAQTPIYLLTDVRSSVMINSAGNIVQQVAQPTLDQARDYIILGRLLHDNKTILNGAVSIPRVIYNTALDADDISISLGSFNITGNSFTSNGTNLKLNKSSGTSYRVGSNYNTDPKNPNTTIDAAKTAFTFKYRYRDGTGNFKYGPIVSDVDPNNLDVGTGTLSAIPANKYTVQRVYIFPGTNNVYLTYGQEIYDNLTNAKTAIATENVIVDPLFQDATLRAYICLKQGATDLSSATNYIVNAGKFGEPIAGGSTGGDVIGPSMAVVNSLAKFSDTTGKLITDNSKVTLDNNGWMTIETLSSVSNTSLIMATPAGLLSASNYTTNNINNWNSVYSNVNTLSTKWDSDYTTTNTNSALWAGGNSAYTTVNNNSALWTGGNSAYTTVNTLSTGWSSTQTTVNANSAYWSDDPSKGNYVFAYDVITKTNPVANVWNNTTFGTNAYIDGWTHTANTSAFICNQTGLYDVNINAQVTRSNNGAAVIELRGILNDSEILGSLLGNYATYSGNNPESLNTNFMVSAVSGQTFAVQWNGSATQAILKASVGTATASVRPSITLNIKRLA